MRGVIHTSKGDGMSSHNEFVYTIKSRARTFTAAAAAVLLCAALVSAATLGRPIVKNGSIYTPGGVMLRGMPIAVYKRNQGPYNFGINPDSLKRMRDEIHLNTIRLLALDPRMKGDGGSVWWTPEEALPYYDKVIANAETLGIYVIVNFHFYWPSYDASDVWNLYHFWDLVCPRYKDKTWVMYEMENETTHGDYNGQMVTCYKEHMRNRAPSSPILHISSMMIAQSEVVNYKEYAQQCGFSWSSGIDFCAIHPYNATQQGYILELPRNGIPTIATEWGNETGGPGSGSSLDNGYGKFFEQNKIAWIDWHDWSGPQLKLETLQLVPFAASQGWAWWSPVAIEKSLPNFVPAGRSNLAGQAGLAVVANGRIAGGSKAANSGFRFSVLPEEISAQRR